MTRLGIDISTEIEENMLGILQDLHPSARSIMEQAHEALCSMKTGRMEAALATLKNLDPNHIGAIASRYIVAFEFLIRAAYHTLLAEQMEAGQ